MTRQEIAKRMLEQATQSGKGTLKAIGHEAQKAATAVNGYYTAKWQNEQLIKQQNQRIEIMNQICWELFCVICGKKYPYLTEINVVEDIVPFRPCPPQVGILLENPNQPLPSFALPQVRDKMNYDIGCFRQWLLVNYMPQQAWNIYPNIMSGMYISDITANGIYAILTVAFLQKI